MAAGIYNFTIEQGTTFTRTFKYKDSEGNPIDLTSNGGFTARMDIRTKAGGDLVNAFSTGGGQITITNTNFITLTIAASTTTLMNFNTAVYDLEIIDPTTSAVTRLLQGKIKLSKEVTTST